MGGPVAKLCDEAWRCPWQAFAMESHIVLSSVTVLCGGLLPPLMDLRNRPYLPLTDLPASSDVV